MPIQYQIVRKWVANMKRPELIRAYNQDSEKLAQADCDKLNRRNKSGQYKYEINPVQT